MNNIKRDRCDDCGCNDLGVEVYAPAADYEMVPVFFVCRRCEPKIFERGAQRDIDSWLEGGSLG